MNKSCVQANLRFLILMTNRLYGTYKIAPIMINASRIRIVNQKIVDLLYNHGHFLGVENRPFVFKILDHFDVWILQFDGHKKKGLDWDEIFIFNKCRQATDYPQREIEKILDDNE